MKTLLLHAEARHGPKAADELLGVVGLEREYLEDEGRALSRDLWLSALEAFAARYGRDELLCTTESVVHPENLGVWTRVVRGATSPEAAYRQLDQQGGEDVMTERWVTLESSPTGWRGMVPVHPESELETSGLPSLARAAELAALPLLFGRAPARVTVRGNTEDAMIELEATWSDEPRARLGRSAAIGAAVAGVGGLGLGLTPSLALTAVGVSALVSAGLDALRGFELRRRAIQSQQSRRISLLERASSLRELRERQLDVFRAGSVVAAKYRLERRLGAGGIGTIWEAIRLGDREHVAIKLLKASVAHDSVVADRLRLEAAALGLAWHPNVVEILDEGHLPDGSCFLVMERLEGESLEQRLTRTTTLEADALLPIALEICDALAAVHAAGIVHRDLKPSNVFLARIGSAERVKLLDFGIARVEWAETRLTLSGVPLGTAGYMSPEQEHGQTVDGRSDLYALGALLYRCLTGKRPEAELAEQLDRLDDDSGVRRLLPEAWRAIIKRAAAPFAPDRHADARAMREALSATSAHGDELRRSTR